MIVEVPAVLPNGDKVGRSGRPIPEQDVPLDQVEGADGPAGGERLGVLLHQRVHEREHLLGAAHAVQPAAAAM